MDMKHWLNDQIKAEIKKAMPILSFPSISLMGISVKELIYDSKAQAEGMRKIAERVDSLASVSMMDLSVEAETFGAAVRFLDNEVPTIVGKLVQDEDEANALPVPAVGSARTGIYISAIEKACALIQDRPVFAGVIGPFSLAGRLMEVSEALVNCLVEPEMVHILMRKTTAFLIDYIRAYQSAGANGVIIAEPLTGLLSPDLAEEFSSPYIKQIADALQDDTFLVIYHNCGNHTIQMIQSILSTGCDGYHFGNAISMRDMLPLIPKDIAVFGNVDPAGQFLRGTPESIRAETLRILSECDKYPNFLISSGCDIPPLSPWENIDAFFETVATYYKTK